LPGIIRLRREVAASSCGQVGNRVLWFYARLDMKVSGVLVSHAESEITRIRREHTLASRAKQVLLRWTQPNRRVPSVKLASTPTTPVPRRHLPA